MWSCQCQHWFIMEGLSFSNFERSFDDDGDGTELTRVSGCNWNIPYVFGTKKCWNIWWDVSCKRGGHLASIVLPPWRQCHIVGAIPQEQLHLVFLSSSTCKLCIDVTTTQMMRCIICHPNPCAYEGSSFAPHFQYTQSKRLVKYNPTHGSTAMKNICRMNTLGVHKATLDFDEGAIECRHKPRNISLSLLHPLLISLVKALAIQELTMLKSSGK